MQLHANAKTCPKSRAPVVRRVLEEKWSLAAAAEAAGVSERTAAKWLRLTAAEIAELLGMALSTVSRWLKRIGLGKRSRLAPPEPPNRYERARPGELVHVDVKKLGRFRRPGHRALGRGPGRRVTQTTAQGHVCVDDATRLAYVEVLPDERAQTATGFLERAVTWFADRGVTSSA